MFQKDVMDEGAFDELQDALGGFLAMLDEMKETGEYDDLVEKVGKNLVEGFREAAKAAREIKDAGKEIIPVVRQITSMAAAMIDVVGGYGNMAKILASVYVINKALRIGAPVLQGGAKVGGWAAGKVFKGKGAAVGKAANALGATPVWVVNMPGGGFSNNGPAIPPSKTPKKANWWSRALLAGNAAADIASPYAKKALKFGGPLTVVTLRGNSNAYDPNNPMFLPPNFGQNNKQKKAKPEIEAAMNRYSEAFKRPESSWSLAGQTPKGNLNLKIEVSDDRIKVTAPHAIPGITIDPDTGIN